MKQFNTRQMVTIAIMSGVAFVLYYLELPVFDPLKMDFSDLPVMIMGYVFGFIPGLLVSVVKNVLHFFFAASSAPIVGQVSNLAYSLFIMIPFVILKPKKLKDFLITSVTAILVSTVGMAVFNYFVSMPWYGIMESSDRLNLLMRVYTPFNLIKGAILCGAFTLIKPQIDRMK